jgi:hypothetical protein
LIIKYWKKVSAEDADAFVTGFLWTRGVIKLVEGAGAAEVWAVGSGIVFPERYLSIQKCLSLLQSSLEVHAVLSFVHS